MEATTQEAPQTTESPQSEAPAPSQTGLTPEGAALNSLAFDPRSLPEDLANEPSLRSFDDVSKLAKSYVHLVKRMGAPPEQIVRLPSAPDDAGWQEVYERLGRPADVSGYGFVTAAHADKVLLFRNCVGLYQLLLLCLLLFCRTLFGFQFFSRLEHAWADLQDLCRQLRDTSCLETLDHGWV